MNPVGWGSSLIIDSRQMAQVKENGTVLDFKRLE